MAFFRQFPKVEYDFNREGVINNMVDIYRSVRPLQNFVDDTAAYIYYEVRNGERPDIISNKLYGNQNFYWTFFVVNETLHDGLQTWPMSQEDLFTYIEREYEGYAITTNPVIRRDSDGLITAFENSLAGSVPGTTTGKFQLGETIRGGTSNATGTLVKKDLDLNQLVVQNVTGAFLGDPTPPSGDNITERITGLTSGDFVDSYQAYKYAEAPHHWFVIGDKEEKVVTNSAYISTGVSQNDITFKSNRAVVEEINDERSRIRVIAPSYIEQFADQFETLLNA
tara:strand:- start:2875 stop:3717 length:843 start_codon:yes stop_codon:yes gene_type:complete